MTLLLGEQAECAGCEAKAEAKWLGYVPLYRHDGKGIVVIIREHAAEMVGRLPLHRYVEWSRLKGGGESVIVKPHALERRWETTLPEKQRPADLVPWLCRLWAMPHIEQALRDSMGPCDMALSLAPTPVQEVAAAARSEEKRHTEEMRAIIRRGFVVKEDGPQLIGDTIPTPERNGKHPRK